MTYLELGEYKEGLGSREVYNDAVVNIFTRLNTAGRKLSREDITFAWLKIGWITACTQNKSAKACIDELRQELEDLRVPISIEDVVSAISFVWSVSFNSGKLINNDELLKGETIRPMAVNISENWTLVVEAATRICEHARDRGLRFREHYQSVNSLAYLWAWYFAALRWSEQRNSKLLEKDSLDKSLAATLDGLMDRWLICSQWANVWSSTSAQSFGSYATRLAVCVLAVAKMQDLGSAIGALSQQLQSELKDIEQAAVNGIPMNADDRQQVRSYYTALWIWNRLEKNRWKSAELVLEQKSRQQISLDVDHIVACDLWKSKLDVVPAQPLTTGEGSEPATVEELSPRVNELGNCMLLKKNFNISKSNRSLKAFLDGVYEFKEGKLTIEEWAKALDLEMAQVDSINTPVGVLRSLFADRTQKIRADLEQFVRGTRARIDVASK